MEHHHFHRKPDWQNQHVRQINRGASHSPYGAYGSFEEAVVCDRGASSNILSLDGEWDFFFAENPGMVPEGFYLPGFETKGWGSITVPGNLETQGYGTPVYTNTQYPFDMECPDAPWLVRASAGSKGPMRERYRPPFVPEKENYVGCYRRTFTVPAGRLGGTALLCFEGVESAFYLWVNGEPVGYSQDSKLPADFEVGPFLREGENVLAVEVFRFSDGTWLEDQDYWYLSGIYRKVNLVWKPGQYIRDWKVQALYEPGSGKGRLTAWCYTNLQDGYGDHKVEMRLLERGGKTILTRVADISRRTPEKRARYSAAHFDIDPGRTNFRFPGLSSLPPDEGPYPPALPHPETAAALFDIPLEQVSPWSPDSPELYTLVFTLLDPRGNAVDRESQKAGFKKIAILNNMVTLNGKRLIVRGVARHEHHYLSGRTMNREQMTEEILLMKRLNFNAVRTSHYPNCPEWYELCDRYGICVLCEANLETHGLLGALAMDGDWSGAFLERAVRMALTCKNAACVIGWSLGNESGVGPNHAAMANWLHDYDPDRFVQYERGDTEKHISDIRCTNYTPVEKIVKWLTDCKDLRPVILAEYAHNQANSSGAFFKYWDAVEQFDRFQGGFLWDWQDKNLLMKDAGGNAFMASGDDYDDIQDMETLPTACSNGILFADYRIKPAAHEVKNCQSPVKVIALDIKAGSFVFRNRCQDYRGDRFLLKWQILEEGEPVREGLAGLPDTPPMEDGPFTLETGGERKPGREYFLNLFILAKEKFHAYERDHEFFRCQFSLGSGILTPFNTRKIPSPELREGGDRVEFRFGSGSVSFDRSSGLLSECFAGDRRVLCAGGKNVFFRAPTGVDRGTSRLGSGILDDWVQSGYDRLERRLEDFSVQRSGDEVRVKTVSGFYVKDFGAESGPVIRSEQAWELDGSGTMALDCRVDCRGGLFHLPRIGLEFTLDPGLENFSYYGRGPWENYADRKSSALLGLYHSKAGEETLPFIPPCECGGHEDTRYLEFLGDDGGLRFSGFSPFHFSVHHCGTEDLMNARHFCDLSRRPEVFLRIDHLHAGLGGDNGWSKNIHREFRIPPEVYQFRIVLRILKKGGIL
jgi:beta-galactosidase